MTPRLKDGTEFEDAYREHRPRAYAAALRVLRDAPAADDVAQEVFMELWRRPGAFDPARGSLASYVSMVARSRALDRLRAQAARGAAQERSRRQAMLGLVGEPESAADLVVRRERSREVLAALDRLPDSQREALLLSYALGLSTREVAEAVRVPLGTAKSRLRLGLSKARTELKAVA